MKSSMGKISSLLLNIKSGEIFEKCRKREMSLKNSVNSRSGIWFWVNLACRILFTIPWVLKSTIFSINGGGIRLKLLSYRNLIRKCAEYSEIDLLFLLLSLFSKIWRILKRTLSFSEKIPFENKVIVRKKFMSSVIFSPFSGFLWPELEENCLLRKSQPMFVSEICWKKGASLSTISLNRLTLTLFLSYK